MIKLLLLSVVFLIPAFAFSSASASIDPDRYLHRTWTTRDGLIQNTVNCMVRGPKGYMWLGTDSGPVRFDGLQFKTITGDIGKVTSLLVHSSGELWTGTYGSGIICYDSMGNRVKNYSKTTGLPCNFIRAMAEDREGNVWLGTASKGIIRFKNNVFTPVTFTHKLSNNHISSLLADSRGNLWIGTADGISIIPPREKQNKVKPVELLSGHLIYSLMEDSKGITWIASHKGIYHAVPSAEKGEYNIRRFVWEDGLFNDSVISLYEDNEGILWFGTAGKGFGNLYKSRFKFYTVNHGLSHHHVTAVYQDYKGDIWIGTKGGGLNRFDGQYFKFYTRRDGLSSDWITSIYGDKEGVLWIGTPTGLNRFKNGSFKIFTTSDGLSGSSIQALYVDSSGSPWIGTHGGGLNRYEPGEKKFQIYGMNHGLSNLFVSVISEDIYGNLWIGIHNGLHRFKDGRFQRFTGKDGLSIQRINDIYADPAGCLWIAPHGKGLISYKNDTFTSFEIRGRPFNTIYRILEDDRRHLWLTTANGVFCISKGELERYEAGKTTDIRYYHLHEGALKTAVFSGGFQPAGWKTTDGSLWLPTVKGITVIPPDKNLFSPGPHRRVHIEKIVVNNLQVDLKAAPPYRFPAGTKKIEFYFNTPDFTAPGMVKYNSRLKGAGYDFAGHLWDDRDEVRLTGSNKEVYRDLPAGRYVFTIAAGGSRGAEVEFYIKRTFFETPWFYLVTFILGLIAAAGIFWLIKRRPKDKWMMPIWAHDEKYKTFKLNSRESKKHLKKLIQLMETEKPYLDADITLSTLAEKLDTGKEVLSQVINRELNLNFNAFLNRYRVEEAKKKLRDPKENQFVLLKIAFDVGFNSKSSFNAVFKKMTGMSPSQYRETYQEK